MDRRALTGVTGWFLHMFDYLDPRCSPELVASREIKNCFLFQGVPLKFEVRIYSVLLR